MDEKAVELKEVKLHPEAKAAILAVLRDSNIVQTREWMHNGSNGYCIVGATCEAYRRAKNEGKWIYGLFLPLKKCLPEERVERWAFDLAGTGKVGRWAFTDPIEKTGYPKIMYEGKPWAIVRLNFKVDFKTLADLIEEQW